MCAQPCGLISWWPAEGTALDAAGQNHGSLRGGASFTAGRVGQAFLLDGVDDFVFIGNANNLREVRDLSIMAWVNPASAPPLNDLRVAGAYSIFSKAAQNAQTTAYSLLLHNPDGAIWPLAAIGVPNNPDPGLSGPASVPVGQWTHIAMTYDATTGLNRLYADGVLVAQRYRPGGITNSDVPVLIGREASALARYFRGAIDEVQVFNRALSAAHVIDYTREDFSRNGRQYDLIFAANGNRTMADYERALTPTGNFVMAGGTNVQMFQAIFFGGLKTKKGGRTMKIFLASSSPNDLAIVQDLIEAGHIRPVMDRCYPLEQTAEAMRYLEAGHAKGKIVVTVGRNGK